MKSAVSITPATAAKRHISLCGCAHHVILVYSLLDCQYSGSLPCGSGYKAHGVEYKVHQNKVNCHGDYKK